MSIHHSPLYTAMVACGMASRLPDARQVYWTYDVTNGLPSVFSFAARWPRKQKRR